MDYFSWKKCVFFLFNIFYTKCHFHKKSQRNIVMRVSMTGSDEQAFFLTIRCYQSEKCGRKKEVGLPTVFFLINFLCLKLSICRSFHVLLNILS